MTSRPWDRRGAALFRNLSLGESKTRPAEDINCVHRHVGYGPFAVTRSPCVRMRQRSPQSADRAGKAPNADAVDGDRDRATVADVTGERLSADIR